MCSDFLYKFVSKISHSKKNPVLYYHKCTWVFMQITRHNYHILIKSEYSGQVFEKSSDNVTDPKCLP